MDTAIAVALVTGSLGTIGVLGNIGERVSAARSSARGDNSRLGLERDTQTSADQRWMIGELKDQLSVAKTELADLKVKLSEAAEQLSAMRSDHETLQRLYREALEQIESMEMENRKSVEE